MRPASSSRGFTLLEMMLVLGVAALMMGVAATAMMRSDSPAARGRRGMSEVVMHLRSVRADAMMTRTPMGVRLESPGAGKGVLAVRDASQWLSPKDETDGAGAGAGVTRSEVEFGDLSPMDDAGAWADGVAVRFDASGRCDARRWRFAERTGAHAGRIVWTIEFDPVSGVARLTPGDGAAGLGVPIAGDDGANP